MDKFIRKCEWCETEFATEWETKAYCSRQHKEQAREHRKRLREGRVYVYRDLTCPSCKTNFETRKQNQIYCSDECRAWAIRQAKRDRDRDYVNQRTPAFKARIYWRGNGICHLCHASIDTTLAWPDPMSFSIDHVIPRSQGGSHSIENLRPAHLSCNAARGDKPITQ